MWCLNHRAMITIISNVPSCGRERKFYHIVAWPILYFTISWTFMVQTTSKWGNDKHFFVMWWKEQSVQNLSSVSQRSHGQFLDWEYVTSNLSAQLLRACPEDVSLAHMGESSLVGALQLDVVVLVSTALLSHCRWKTDSWELHVKNLHGWASALDIALHVWAAKMQTCRTFPLARVAALSQKTNIAWGKHAEKGYLQPWEKERIGNKPMWEGKSECGNHSLHRWFWHIPL